MSSWLCIILQIIVFIDILLNVIIVVIFDISQPTLTVIIVDCHHDHMHPWYPHNCQQRHNIIVLLHYHHQMILINISVMIFLSSGLTQLRIPSCYLKVGILIETSLKKEIDKTNFKKKFTGKLLNYFWTRWMCKQFLTRKTFLSHFFWKKTTWNFFCWTQ